MIENTNTETTVELNTIEKKEWETPEMTKLDVKETQSLSWTSRTEDGTFRGFFGGNS